MSILPCHEFTAAAMSLALTFIPLAPNQSMKAPKAADSSAASFSLSAHTLNDTL